MKSLPLFFYILFFILFSSFTKDQIRFQKIDMTDGLSYNSVLCIMQDHDQYLWVGTRDGLNKLNSIDVEIFRHDINDSLSLSHSHVNCIYESTDHTIWIGTANGVNKYNKGENNFTPYYSTKDSTGLSNQYVRCISEDAEGNIWIGTAFGINRYNSSTGLFDYLYPEIESVPSNDIISLFFDHQYRMWVGTKDGLYVKNTEGFLRVKLEKNNEDIEKIEVRDIKQGEDKVMWVSTENEGVYSFVFDNGQLNQLNHICKENSSLVSNSVRKILLEKNVVWCATLEGLTKIEGDSIINITYSAKRPLGISNSSIHDIIKDSFGGYWLATYTGGLNYYHPQNNLFPHIRSIVGNENNLVSDEILCFLKGDNESVWVGTSGGISYWDTKTNRFNNKVKNISNNSIKSISADQNDNLWIGTYDGLNFYDVKTGGVIKFFHDDDNRNSLNQNQVHAVHVDKRGMVWIGMNGGEFQVFNPSTKQFNEVAGVGKIVNTIFEDSKGRLWVGERYGLRCLDTQTQRHIDISSLTNQVKGQLNYVNCISEDSSGNILIGTAGSGLIIFCADKVYWFNMSNGLNDNTINAIEEDDKGCFWISTNKGISKLIFSNDDGDLRCLHSTDFTIAHGLQGKQFEKGCALKTDNGKLIFGGVNGINIVDPVQVAQIKYYPSVVLCDVKIRHNKNIDDARAFSIYKALSENALINLKYNERNIDIHFAGINFVNPPATYYRYYLNSLGDKWINLGHQRAINFTYLPVGNHELLIQASSSNESWGDKYTSLKINILPPWWQTPCAFVIYGIAILGLLYVFFHLSIKWASLKNSLQMEQFKYETELELHESKLRFFTDVSHELRTPLTLILAPLERIIFQKGLNEDLNRQLLLIRRNGERMMQLINQVLNLRKFETGHVKLQVTEGDMISFLSELNLSFKEIALLHKIDYEFRAETDKLDAWFDRDKLETIIYNLLSNAFKNTDEGGSVIFGLKIKKTELKKTFSWSSGDEKYIQIDVSNEGECIPEEVIKLLFERFYSNKGDKYSGKKGAGVGLELTKRMVYLHHGHISVQSVPKGDKGKGVTTFSVILPFEKKQFGKYEIVNDYLDIETPLLYTKEPKSQELIRSLDHDPISQDMSGQKDTDMKSILIVEDNREVRQFIIELFKDNYFVEEAENGLEGWDKAIEQGPDLIISDVMMPELDGIQLCGKLKKDARTSHIPVLLLTARATSSFINEGYETGADEYVTKPFSAEFLMIRVKNLIQQRELMRHYFMRQSILEPKEITVTSVDERLLKKAVDYINENMENTTISVEKLSKELGLSRVHFYRKVKALTSLTAVDFIRSIRLKRAASLLKTNKLSIKEVQNMVGFENADYFRKCFKNQFDMSPSDYAASFEHKD